ncbi:MAG: dockerin type I repeat-containing protein, partial [Oscillospiraceae bacterium]|nr:dockerin type I repeat-containing protein [Oscillospiraceae bacterium]
ENDLFFELQVNAYHYEKGDINMDGDINITDLTILHKYLLKKGDILPEQMYYADMDNNNKLNVFDSILIKRLLILK